MANKDGEGFAWSQMWVAWRKQSTNIQKLWMVWKINPLTGEETGLKQVLTEIMEIETRDVQDDIFGHAPKDVRSILDMFLKWKKRNRKQNQRKVL